MIPVWLLKDGTTITSGDEPKAFGTLPFEDCVSKLGLRENDFLSGLEKPLLLGNVGPLTPISGPRHVILKIDASEAKKQKWKPGFYGISRISVQEAAKILKPLSAEN
jgi:hypothetical protein